VIDTIDPVEQEKHLKYNHLVANAAAIQNVIDLTRAVRDLQAEPEPFDTDLVVPFPLEDAPESATTA
jgi:hypothetical protein